jgi:hypothetical protein
MSFWKLSLLCYVADINFVSCFVRRAFLALFLNLYFADFTPHLLERESSSVALMTFKFNFKRGMGEGEGVGGRARRRYLQYTIPDRLTLTVLQCTGAPVIIHFWPCFKRVPHENFPWAPEYPIGVIFEFLRTLPEIFTTLCSLVKMTQAIIRISFPWHWLLSLDLNFHRFHDTSD